MKHTIDLITLDALRRETPGVEAVAHFNNAGAALMPRPVFDAVHGHLERELRHGGYEAEARAAAATGAVYASLARLVGADADEIAVTDSATRAWDAVFYALPFAPGDEIITSAPEYVSNYVALLQVCRRTGAALKVVPADASGAISLPALERAIGPRTKLISLTHVPTNGGLVQPAAAVGRIARAAGVPFLLDACQAVGQLALDVRALGCDALTATGRKYLRGPRGTGFLYARREFCRALEPAMLDTHSARLVGDRYVVRDDARRFELWECSHALRLGLGAAADYALGVGMAAIEARVKELAGYLREALTPAATVHEGGGERCGIVTFSVPGREAAAVREALAAQAINVSTTSPVGSPLDGGRGALGALLRASVHYYNTHAEIDALVAALRQERGTFGASR